MVEYMAVQEAAKLWEVSERQVQKLCKVNPTEGAVHLSRVWRIPEDIKNLWTPEEKAKNESKTNRTLLQ